MALSILSNASVSGGSSFTAAAGSNRVVLLMIGVTSAIPGNIPTITGVTLGSQAFTQVGTSYVTGSARYMRSSAWIIKEANIPAGANTITVSGTNLEGGASNTRGAIFTLGGVDQTTPIVDSDGTVVAAATSVSYPATDVTAGGLSVITAGSQSDNSGTTWGTVGGYTRVGTNGNNFDFNGSQITFYKAISSTGTESPTLTWTSSNSAAAMIVSVREVSSAPTISSGTPTGRITSSPTLGFTTNTTGVNGRIVGDSAANLVGITSTQVMAGQKASGAAAAKDTGSFAVLTTTPTSTGITGLTPGLFSFAAAQTGSNVLIWNTLVGHSGYQSVLIGTPNTTAANRITAVPDIASGDYLDWGDIVGTGTVVINNDGTFDADVGVTSFTVYCGNLTDGWGAAGVQTIVADTFPPSWRWYYYR